MVALVTRPLTGEDAARHWPFRPAWTCDAGCGDWPCAPIRGHLQDTLTAVETSILMACYYRDAISELDLTPDQVHRRFLGWVRAKASAAKVRR